MTVLIVALFVSGLALLVAEAHLPTFGIVGTAGVAALVTGLALATESAGGARARRASTHTAASDPRPQSTDKSRVTNSPPPPIRRQIDTAQK